MANIVNPNLPADLPTDWTPSQYVSPNGSEVSLSQQHGYNYLMEQVNAAQTAVNTLAEQAQEAVSGLESGALTATATRSGTTVAITGPEDAVTVTFLAPADWTEGDSYTYNGTPITVTDLNGNPVTDGWKQGAVLTFQISGGVAYFVGGASGSFLPLSGGTMTGPAVGAPGGSTIPQFRNVYYGTEALTPGSSPLPEGTLYITPEMEYEGAGKRTCRFVVGTSTAGWTAADCDYLCDGTADDVEINAAIQALPSTGGEIVILDGTYNITATITVNKSNVTLSGNGAATILQREWTQTSSNSVIEISGCTNVTISKIHIRTDSSVTDSSNDTAIRIEQSYRCNIFDNIIEDGSSAVYLSGSSNCIVSCNIFQNNYKGVSINTLPANSNGNIITGNVCTGAEGSGFNITSSYGNSAEYNTISGNIAYGCNIGVYLSASNNNTVVGNCLYNNSVYGIGLNTACSSNSITGNSCIDNGIGINVGYSNNNNTVSGNTFMRGTGQVSDYSTSQYTIYVERSSSSNNLFVGNNIMGKNYVDNGTNNTWANNKFE